METAGSFAMDSGNNWWCSQPFSDDDGGDNTGEPHPKPGDIDEGEVDSLCDSCCCRVASNIWRGLNPSSPVLCRLMLQFPVP